MMRPFCRIVVAFAVAGLSACGTGPNPVRVWGEVELNGKPVTGGRIRFEPINNPSLPVREVEVTDGTYNVPAAKGLTPGEYLVKVEAYRPTGKKRPNPYREGAPPIDILEQYVPAVYSGNKSPLRVTVTPNKEANHFSLALLENAEPKSPR